MTKETSRLLNILDQMDKDASTPEPSPAPATTDIEPPTHIGRGRPRKHKRQPDPAATYKKLTITITPETYNALIRESLRRKMAQAPDATVSALIREMTFKYLGGDK